MKIGHWYMLMFVGLILVVSMTLVSEASFTRKTIIYHYTANDGVVVWENNPDLMNDNDEDTFADTTIRSDPQNNTVNNCGNQSGNPRDVHARLKGNYSGALSSKQLSMNPIYMGRVVGGLLNYIPTTTYTWSPWYNVSSSPRSPGYNNWTWDNITQMDMKVTARKFPAGVGRMYCGMVELRVNFTNQYPYYNTPNPSDGSTWVQLNSNVSLNIYDNESDQITAWFLSNSSGSWEVFDTDIDYNGTFWGTPGNFSEVNTTYYWQVNITDGYSWIDSPVYSFRTREDIYKPSVSFVDPTPPTGTVNSEQSSFVVNVSSSDNESEHYVITDFNNSLMGWWHGDYLAHETHPVLKNWVRNNASYDYYTQRYKLIMYQGMHRTGEGYYRSSLECDGVDDYASNTNIAQDYEGLELSFGGWIRWDTISQDPTGYDVPLAIMDANEYGWEIYTDTSNMLYAYYYSPSVYTWTTAYPIVTDTWYHVMLVQYENNISLYVDGTWWDDCTAGDLHNSMTFYVGGFGVSYSFDGLLDEIVYFNRSISGMEVRALYNASVTQYNRSFTNLGLGEHTFQSCGVDRAMNKNCTGIRTYTIANTEPHIYNEIPNSSVYDVGIDPNLSFELEDDDGNTMNVEWYSNSSGSWLLFNQNKSVGNGTISYVNTNMSDYNTTYYWYVAVFDGFDWNTSPVFNFTTEVEPTIKFGQLNGLGGSTNLGWEGDLSGGLSIEDRIMGYNVYMVDSYGIVDSVRCRLRSTTIGKDARCLIYFASDNGSSPPDRYLVPGAVSDSINITSSSWEWYTFTFPVEVTLDGNRQYYIAVWGNNSDGLLTVGYASSISGGRGINRNNSVNFDHHSAPSPWANQTLFSGGAISIFVVYTPWFPDLPEDFFQEYPANNSNILFEPSGVNTSVWVDYTEQIVPNFYMGNNDTDNLSYFGRMIHRFANIHERYALMVDASAYGSDFYLTNLSLYIGATYGYYLYARIVYMKADFSEPDDDNDVTDWVRGVPGEDIQLFYEWDQMLFDYNRTRFYFPSALIEEVHGWRHFVIEVRFEEIPGYNPVNNPYLARSSYNNYSFLGDWYSWDGVNNTWYREDFDYDITFQAFGVSTGDANIVNVSFSWWNDSIPGWEHYGFVRCAGNGSIRSLNTNFTVGNYRWRVFAENQAGTVSSFETYNFSTFFIPMGFDDRFIVWLSLCLFAIPVWLLFSRRKREVHGIKN